MKRLALIFAVALILTGGAVTAQESEESGNAAPPAAEQVQAEQQADATPEEEVDPRDLEVVCHREAVTGSRTRFNRTCLTRAEWREFHRATGEGVRGLQGQASGGAACRQDAGGGCNF